MTKLSAFIVGAVGKNATSSFENVTINGKEITIDGDKVTPKENTMISVKEINEYTAKDAEELKQYELRIDASLKLLDKAKRVVLDLGRIKDANVTKLQAIYDKGGRILTYHQRSGRNETWYEVILEPKPTLPKQPNVR